MRKYWLRFFCFWIVFTLLFSLLNLSMKIENQRWNDFYALPEDSVEVVFIGNSHNFATFQPAIIDDILPVDSYVIGTGAENIVLSYYELKEVLRTQHPKAIVLETFVLDLDDTNISQEYYYDFLDAGRWNANKTAIAARYLTPDLLYTLFPALRTRLSWEKPYLYFQQLTGEISGSPISSSEFVLGSTPQTEVIADSEYAALVQSTPGEYKQPAADIRTYLGKFYELCRENGIQLILTTTPMVSDPENETGKYAPFDVSGFVVENDIPYIQYDPAAFNHLHFSDSNHVNEFGSISISAQMAVALGRILDLPVDQAKVDYYHSFAFTDYSIDQSGDDMTIRLTPQETAAPLEYKWKVTSGDVVIAETDWQTESFLHFTMEDEGKYTVTADIRNKTGDFSFQAVFTPEIKG